MGTSVVGQLAVLLKADSAQFESDLGKARAAVAATTAEFKMFGKVGVEHEAAFIDTTGGLEEQMKGSRAALGILTQGLREMGGAAAAEFGRMSYHLAHVAEGAGLVGISMAAIGLSVMAVTKTMEAFRASNENAIEGAATRRRSRARAEAPRHRVAQLLGRADGPRARRHRRGTKDHEGDRARARRVRGGGLDGQAPDRPGRQDAQQHGVVRHRLQRQGGTALEVDGRRRSVLGRDGRGEQRSRRSPPSSRRSASISGRARCSRRRSPRRASSRRRSTPRASSRPSPS